MRLVLDTNVLLSACLKPEGLEAQLVALVLTGAHQACVTQEVWAEYLDVLFREKFAGAHEQAETALRALDALVIRVAWSASTAPPFAAASDEDDNRFLECAVAADADYLITGNLRHFPAQCGRTQIVNARAFFTTALR